MGYYTRFTLVEASTPETPVHESFRILLEEQIDYDPFDEECKWYNHVDDVKRAMIASGTERVKIHGEGEEQGDVWDETYQLVDHAGQRIEVRRTRYKLVPGDEEVVR